MQETALTALEQEQWVKWLASASPFSSIAPDELRTLADELAVVSLQSGQPLIHQGEPADALYIVVEGVLQATARSGGERVILGEIREREVVGEAEALTGGKRGADVVAVEPSIVLKLPRNAVEQLAARAPALAGELTAVARRRQQRNQLIAALHSLVGGEMPGLLSDVEAESTRVHLQRGETLFEAGSPSDRLFLLLSGRLQARVPDPEGDAKLIGEIFPGESVGEMGVISGEARTATVIAVRNSALAAITEDALDRLVARHPQLGLALARVLVGRAARSIKGRARADSSVIVAVLPASPDVPLGEFCRLLVSALGRFGPSRCLTSDLVDAELGAAGKAQLPEGDPLAVRLDGWLDLQEGQYRFVVYQADQAATSWTRRCAQHADRVLLVALAAADPAASPLERALAPERDGRGAAPTTLVLIHPDGSRPPRGTTRWLSARRVEQHHHVRWSEPGDIERVARFLAGRALGLALGGGGARGLAHLGIIQAMVDLGVPIDMVGGTSAGGGFGALYAMTLSARAARDILWRTTVADQPYRVYTLPLMWLVHRERLDRSYRDGYSDGDLEDTWINCFTVACDISAARLVVQRSGPVWRAARATQCLPGLFAPIIADHHLLVDGGVMDNVPGHIMRQLCRGPVIAVDVSPDVELTTDYSYEEMPSPWQVLWSRINPLRPSLKVFTIPDVIARTLAANTNRTRYQVREATDLYLRPPVQKYGLLEFTAIDELVALGYEYAMSRADELVRFK